MKPPVIALAGLSAAAVPAAAGAARPDTVVIDLAGVQIRHATNQSRTSSPRTLDESKLYAYAIDGMVRGQGLVFGTLFGTPRPLADLLEEFSPGSSERLRGRIVNPPGTHPFDIVNERFEGMASPGGFNVTIELNLRAGVRADDTAFFEATNVVINPSFLGYFSFTSGSVTLRTQCYADCDTSLGPGTLDVFDFLCFQNAFDAGDPYACQCDTSTGPGTCDVFDFLCFQNEFDAGCP